MTPEAKTKELVQKFDDLLPCQGTTTGQTPIDCALIVVEEIINLPTVWFDKNACLEEDESDTTEYWEEVKNHLLKM